MPKPTDERLHRYLIETSHLSGSHRIWDGKRSEKTYGKRVLRHPLIAGAREGGLAYYADRQARREMYRLTYPDADLADRRVVRDEEQCGEAWCIEPTHMRVLTREEQQALKTKPEKKTTATWWDTPNRGMGGLTPRRYGLTLSPERAMQMLTRWQAMHGPLPAEEVEGVPLPEGEHEGPQYDENDHELT